MLLLACALTLHTRFITAPKDATGNNTGGYGGSSTHDTSALTSDSDVSVALSQ